MKLHYVIPLFLILIGCSSDEPEMSEEQPAPSDNLYLEFNQWVYSQMNRQYLWREDLPDSLECNYDLPPKAFFESLLSDKDRFSYFTNNSSYNGGRAESYGFAYQKVKDRTNESALYVLYVTSPAARKAGLRPGNLVRIRHCDSNVVELTRLSLENGKLMEDGSQMRYAINKFGNKGSTVLLDSIYQIADRKIGYMCYLEYDAIDDVAASIMKFKNGNISDLILDLRYNPGGYVRTSQYLCNCIVPQSGYGGIFQQCSYNDILSGHYLETTGNSRTFTYYDYPPETTDKILGTYVAGLRLKRLYVLTSRNTASASEATIVCLRPYMEVVTIGEQTVGKGVGSWNISDRRFKYSIQPITMRYYNAEGVSTPDDGIIPDYPVPDGYNTNKKEIGNIDEPLLSTALSLIVPMSVRHNESAGSKDIKSENVLTPVGEPSYVIEFKNKHYNEIN